MDAKEVVLPSGRFARMRRMTWWDRVCTRNENPDLWVLGMAVRVVTIDGEALTVESAGAMDLEEANPIIEMVTAQIADALNRKGVS